MKSEALEVSFIEILTILNCEYCLTLTLNCIIYYPFDRNVIITVLDSSLFCRIFFITFLYID